MYDRDISRVYSNILAYVTITFIKECSLVRRSFMSAGFYICNRFAVRADVPCTTAIYQESTVIY